jgi:hypothetical protein
MIEVIVSANKEWRNKQKEKSLQKNKGEIIYLDDTKANILDLKEYAFPSLFSIGTPMVFSSFLLDEYQKDLSTNLLKTLLSSPTLFIFEEISLPRSVIKTLEKEGAIVFEQKEEKKAPKANTIFAVTNALTAPNKKDRWLSYQASRQEHSAEALIGILYWKLRQLIDNNSNKKHFLELYRSLMLAQKESWQKGFSLDLAIEKVILES